MAKVGAAGIFEVPPSGVPRSTVSVRFTPIWLILGTLAALVAVIALSPRSWDGVLVFVMIFAPVLVAETVVAPLFFRLPAKKVIVSGRGLTVQYPDGAEPVLHWRELSRPVRIVDRRELPCDSGSQGILLVAPLRWLRPSVSLSPDALAAVLESAREAGARIEQRTEERQLDSTVRHLHEYSVCRPGGPSAAPARP